MTSSRVHLRPFEEVDLEMCERAMGDPAFGGPFEWNGFSPTQTCRQRWLDDQLLGRSPFSLVVARDEDDRAVGWVDWRETDRAGPYVWEIGALIIPEARGDGVGTAAQSQLVDYLFATTPTNRIWAGTEVENVAEQRALEKCGLRQEGLLCGHHFRDGEWRDSYIYGITRADNQNRIRP